MDHSLDEKKLSSGEHDEGTVDMTMCVLTLHLPRSKQCLRHRLLKQWGKVLGLTASVTQVASPEDVYD